MVLYLLHLSIVFVQITRLDLGQDQIWLHSLFFHPFQNGGSLCKILGMSGSMIRYRSYLPSSKEYNIMMWKMDEQNPFI